MKKIALLSVILSCSFLTSCIEENAKDKGDESLIPSDIREDGVLGSWAHGLETPDGLTIAREWYIEGSRSTLVSRCEFDSGPVAAVVQVRSRISGSILTILENKNKLVQVGEQNCYVEAIANTSFTLNLESENILRITRAGTTTQYTRINHAEDAN